VRAGGHAGPFLDGFAESMCAKGYSSETSGSYLQAADHLGQTTVLDSRFRGNDAPVVMPAPAYARAGSGRHPIFSQDTAACPGTMP